MLGFPSLTKLLVLAAIVLAVWYGFKLIGRLDAQRKLQAKQQERAAAAGRATAVPDAEEMIACAAAPTAPTDQGLSAGGLNPGSGRGSAGSRGLRDRRESRSSSPKHLHDLQPTPWREPRERGHWRRGVRRRGHSSVPGPGILRSGS